MLTRQLRQSVFASTTTKTHLQKLQNSKMYFKHKSLCLVFALAVVFQPTVESMRIFRGWDGALYAYLLSKYLQLYIIENTFAFCN